MGDAPLMLGVSGMRGIVGRSLTPEVAMRYAAAFGAWLRERDGGGKQEAGTKRKGKRPRVVIGRDGRAGGDAICAAAAAGLAAVGCDVVDTGVTMTPAVGVMVDHLGAAGGMVVTASHNPQEWNGLKLLVREGAAKRGEPAACAPGVEIANAIIQRYRAGGERWGGWDLAGYVMDSGDAEPTRGRLSDVHPAVRLPIAGLGASAVRAIQRKRIRVVLDSVNGAGRILGPIFLGTLKCRITHVGADASGVFSHPPEPIRENLTGLCRRVRKSRCEVGFAQDPDADRLAIVDERGEYIGEEDTLALAAEALLSMREDGTKAPRHQGNRRKSGPPVLVANLSTSRMIDDIAARHGARVVRTPVGEANVVEAMKREKAAGGRVVLGGEGNGGVIWPEVTYVRDSLSAMGLVLALMARSGKKVSELVAGLPAYEIEKRKVSIARREDAGAAVERIAAHYTSAPSHLPPRIDRQDGVRVDWVERRAWLHVRASNTEPIMRLIGEAPTAVIAKDILDDAERVIAAPARGADAIP